MCFESFDAAALIWNAVYFGVFCSLGNEGVHVFFYIIDWASEQFSSHFDETWHTYSLIFKLDFVESFLW